MELGSSKARLACQCPIFSVPVPIPQAMDAPPPGRSSIQFVPKGPCIDSLVLGGGGGLVLRSSGIFKGRGLVGGDYVSRGSATSMD